MHVITRAWFLSLLCAQHHDVCEDVAGAEWGDDIVYFLGSIRWRYLVNGTSSTDCMVVRDCGQNVCVREDQVLETTCVECWIDRI